MKQIERNVVNRKGAVRYLKNLADRTEGHRYFIDVFSSTSINQFVTRVNKLIDNIDCSRYEPRSTKEECERKVKGDLFELFTVLFFNNFGSLEHLFIRRIKWASRNQIGFDFEGENRDGDPCIIQSKFVSNAAAKFETDLTTFFGSLPEGLKVKRNRPARVLFTTANIPGGKIKTIERDSNRNFLVIDRNEIKRLTKEDLSFWKDCKETAELIFKRKLTE